MVEYLKIPEVAQRLDVSEKTARRIVKGGKLPSVFIGGAYRVSEEDLERYVEAAKVQPGDGSGKVQAPPLLENGPAGPALPEAPDTQLAEERQKATREWVEALERIFKAQAEAALQEVNNPNSTHFRNTNTAADWVADRQEEATRLRNLIHEHILPLLPLSPGVGLEKLITGERLMHALTLFHPIIGLDNAAQLGKQRIARRSDTPDEVAARRLEKAEAEAEEARKRIEEMRRTASG